MAPVEGMAEAAVAEAEAVKAAEAVRAAEAARAAKAALAEKAAEADARAERAAQAHGLLCRCLADFAADESESSELSLKAGELAIKVDVEAEDNGWLKVQPVPLSDRLGYVPSSFVCDEMPHGEMIETFVGETENEAARATRGQQLWARCV